MFGLFVFRNYFFLGLMAFLLGSTTAQAAAAVVYKARILNDQAMVYQNSDFDSKVLGRLAVGKVYEVSRRAFGPFHKIKVGSKIGFISDTDIQPLNFKFDESPDGAKKSKAKKDRAENKSSKKKIFSMTRFAGLSFLSANYSEDTMGKTYSENLGFFGFKLSGPDIVFEGDTASEINLSFHNGAPGYYDTATGQSSAGWMFLMDVQMQNVWTLAPTVIGFFGFGPMLRFTKFDLALKDPTTGVVTTYAANDAALGAAFSLGAAFRISSAALRLEGKYFWEKKQYAGLGAALQFQF